jgi:hypothetical protein
MAADPTFAVTPVIGSALLGNAETNLQVPTTTSTLVTAAATGTYIYEIIVAATAAGTGGTTVAGVVYIFCYDGSTYHMYDNFQVSALTASTSVAPFRASKQYQSLILKTGWSLRASQSIAGNASVLKVTAVGADF